MARPSYNVVVSRRRHGWAGLGVVATESRPAIRISKFPNFTGSPWIHFHSRGRSPESRDSITAISVFCHRFWDAMSSAMFWKAMACDQSMLPIDWRCGEATLNFISLVFPLVPKDLGQACLLPLEFSVSYHLKFSNPRLT